MIRNVVIHQHGQLPFVADVQELPTASDANLICTNVRMADGKRPTFIEKTDSWFLIPMSTIRFLEVPRAAMAAGGQEMEEERQVAAPTDEELAEAALAEGPVEPDPDLLARIRDI